MAENTVPKFRTSRQLLREILPVLGLPTGVKRLVIELDIHKAPQFFVVGIAKERAGSLAEAIARGVVVPVESVEVDEGTGDITSTPTVEGLDCTAFEDLIAARLPAPPSMDAPQRTVMEVMQGYLVRDAAGNEMRLPYDPSPMVFAGRWEDQERGNYDVDQLRKEFRDRLYADTPAVVEG